MPRCFSRIEANLDLGEEAELRRLEAGQPSFANASASALRHNSAPVPEGRRIVINRREKKTSKDCASPNGGAPRHGALAMAAPGRAILVRARRHHVRGPRREHLSETGDSRVSGVT
jgi:hypothetical protein